MEEGVLGIGFFLIYVFVFYVKIDELIVFCEVVSEYGGMYIIYMCSEGNKFLEGVDEVIEIVLLVNIVVEIYYLKVVGKNNWLKMD